MLHGFINRGVGEFDPNLITDYTNATANLVSAIRGNGSNATTTTTTTNNDLYNLLLLQQMQQQSQNQHSNNSGNTLMYVGIAAALGIGLVLLFKK